ncbi:MAG: ABC1 kinase family protein [Patescibacteria group bacterium]
MNIYRFVKLLHNIYAAKEPDLDFIQETGLLAVKIGQMHAVRIDFLPADKCKKLAQLYRKTVPLPAEDAKKLFEQLASQKLKDELEFFDEKPLASASVGQVHRGRLRSGEEIVIKMIKRRVRDQFVKEVQQVKKYFKWAMMFYPKLKGVANPQGLLDMIERSTLSELDLAHEAAGQKILRDIFIANKDKYDLSLLKFPKVYEELSGERIMVTEFIEGRTVDELLEVDGLDYEVLLDLFHVHGFYMFQVGTFHGDIHPGNVIFTNGRIFFVDTGYIGRVEDYIRIGLFNFFENLSYYKYKECAYYLNEMAEKKIEGQAFADFEKNFLELYKDFKGKSVSEISLTKMMMRTIKLGVLSGMEFSESIFDIIKSLMYMDGMVLRCNPDAVLMEDMRKFIGELKPNI